MMMLATSNDDNDDAPLISSQLHCWCFQIKPRTRVVSQDERVNCKLERKSLKSNTNSHFRVSLSCVFFAAH